MNDQITNQIGHRSHLGRAGVTALNLFLPGLGLLRIGNWRAGGLLLLAPFELLALITLAIGYAPIRSYTDAMIALGVVIGLSAALYLVPAILTWRQSAVRSPPHGWSRWYGLCVIAAAVLLMLQAEEAAAHHFYKAYYVPTDSMIPTIGRNDRLFADMRWRGPFKRGDIVIFKGPNGARISRIAALPGDRISMREGKPTINGMPPYSSALGQIAFLSRRGEQSALMIAERLPGEASSHQVLDSGPSPFDDTPEVVVPQRHVFLLGDNRDASADSRVPPAMNGAGMVSFADVTGRPMYIDWSSDRRRIGMRLDH